MVDRPGPDWLYEDDDMPEARVDWSPVLGDPKQEPSITPKRAPVMAPEPPNFDDTLAEMVRVTLMLERLAYQLDTTLQHGHRHDSSLQSTMADQAKLMNDLRRNFSWVLKHKERVDGMNR